MTPEQWVEIGELINENKQSRSLSDLEIIDFDEGENNKLWVEIYNSDNGYVYASFIIMGKEYYGLCVIIAFKNLNYGAIIYD